MSRLLYADLARMYGKRRFWLFATATVAIATMFITMQFTAMDYEVPISRVIFLPMSFYGVLIAALISLFVGDDFSDGVIRNKIVAGRSRHAIYLSNLTTVWSACLVLYLISATVTTGVGIFLFEIDISANKFFIYLTLGIFTSMAYSSIFCTLSMLIGNKSSAVMFCMALAFFLLCMCLHTNQIMVQPEYKNGIRNPLYAEGVRRLIYSLFHDLNPSGQAAQLSSMEYFNVFRWICCDLFWILISIVPGPILFYKKDVK